MSGRVWENAGWLSGHDLNQNLEGVGSVCNRRIVLALENATRYIAQCEHGTVSIVWDNLVIRLCPADFAQVVGMVEEASANVLDAREPTMGFRLKLGTVILIFSPEDLLLPHR